MFNGLQIKLGEESRTRKVDTKNFDALDAFAGVVAASENLDRTAMQMEMLQASMSNIETGHALAVAVADATGDNGVAVAVGRESLRMSLSMIGQAGLADEAYAGTESLTAGAEAAENIFSKMISKVKELAVKAWKWIIELINKITNFVLGLFGKSEDTAEQLIKLLKKAKENGKIRLNATEFDKAVATRLAKEIPLLAANKATSVSDYMDSINKTAKSIETSTGLLVDTKTGNGDDAKGDMQKVLDDIITAKDTFSKGTTYGYVKYESDGSAVYSHDEIIGKLLTTVNNAFGTDKVEIKDKDDIAKVDLVAAVDDAADEIVAGKGEVIVVTPDKVVVLVAGFTEDGKEAYDALSKQKDLDGNNLSEVGGYKKVGSIVNKLFNGIKVKTVTVKIEDISDATDNADMISPLDYTDAKQVADLLKKAGKDVEKNLKAMNKTVKDGDKKAEKDYEKLSKEIATIVGKDGKAAIPADNATRSTAVAAVDDTHSIASVIRGQAKVLANVMEKLAKHNLDITRETAKAATDNANAIVRSKIGHIITESVKLYKAK